MVVFMLDWHVGTIITINIVLFARTIFFGIVIDDIDWYAKISRGDLDWNKYTHLKRPYAWYRFITDRLYAGGTFGTNTTVDHTITLALHIITCILIYFTFGVSTVSYLTAILYSIHPTNHQTSIWLNGRRYALINILALISLLTHATVALCIIIAPFILHHFLLRNEQRRKIYTINRPVITHIAVILKSVGFNMIKLTAIPRTMSLYPYLENASMQQLTKTDIYEFIGISTVVILIITGHPLILLLLLTASSTIPYTQTCSDRYMSLPIMFLLYIVCNTLSAHLDILAFIMVPIFICQSLSLQSMYINIQSFYDYHKEAFPELKKLPLLKVLYPNIQQ